jgi:shikimate kinase
LNSSRPAADGARRQCVLFVGMMGAGKSTVANLLAARLGWPVVDTDGLVESRAGATVAEVFDREGEAAFRAAEAQAISELAQVDEPLVVSVGGGAVLSEANRSAMRAAGTVVWLRARPETLAARVGSGRARPLLHRSGVTPQAALEQLAVEREAYYRDAADLTVDVDDLSAGQAADVVISALTSALALDRRA